MIPAKRRALVLEQIQLQGVAAISELSELLKTSSSTIRRDLDYLTQQGYLERTHGGASVRPLTRPTFEPHAEIASHVARSAKVTIGTAAANKIKPQQSVIFDSSSTVLEAARALVRRRIPITAVTNDLATAAELSKNSEINLVVVGGTLRPHSMTLTGDPGTSFLAGLHVDIAFLGAHSLVGGALSETSVDVASIKRLSARAAEHRMVLADVSKFAAPAFCRVIGLEEINTLIVDAAPSKADQDFVRSHGVTLEVAAAAEMPQSQGAVHKAGQR